MRQHTLSDPAMSVPVPVVPSTPDTQAPAPSGTFVRFADSPFELYQPYPPAGDQPEAIAQLVEGVQNGEVFQTLLGVTGSGKTFTMANVIARLGRPAAGRLRADIPRSAGACRDRFRTP